MRDEILIKECVGQHADDALVYPRARDMTAAQTLLLNDTSYGQRTFEEMSVRLPRNASEVNSAK